MGHQSEMMKHNLRPSFSFSFVVLVMTIRGESCKSSSENFGDILRTRQIPGRLPTKEEFRLSEHSVVSEMECLDICLRRPTCASFNVLTKTSHINCIAYNDIPNSLHLKPTYQNSGWLFFNVSSLELQQVSYHESTADYVDGSETKLMHPWVVKICQLILFLMSIVWQWYRIFKGFN